MSANASIAVPPGLGYPPAMVQLTRQEQWVLTLLVGLLLVGLAVQAWRTAHPADPAPLTQP
jgi:hypothetical protein